MVCVCVSERVRVLRRKRENAGGDSVLVAQTERLRIKTRILSTLEYSSLFTPLAVLKTKEKLIENGISFFTQRLLNRNEKVAKQAICVFRTATNSTKQIILVEKRSTQQRSNFLVQEIVIRFAIGLLAFRISH